MLFKEIVDAHTDARTHGRWTTDNGPSQKLTLSTLCSGELKMKSYPLLNSQRIDAQGNQTRIRQLLSDLQRKIEIVNYPI